MFGYKVARLGTCANKELVRTFLALFYADDRYLESRDPELLQELVDTLSNFLKALGCYATPQKRRPYSVSPVRSGCGSS